MSKLEEFRCKNNDYYSLSIIDFGRCSQFKEILAQYAIYIYNYERVLDIDTHFMHHYTWCPSYYMYFIQLRYFQGGGVLLNCRLDYYYYFFLQNCTSSLHVAWSSSRSLNPRCDKQGRVNCSPLFPLMFISFIGRSEALMSWTTDECQKNI